MLKGVNTYPANSMRPLSAKPDKHIKIDANFRLIFITNTYVKFFDKILASCGWENTGSLKMPMSLSLQSVTVTKGN